MRRIKASLRRIALALGIPDTRMPALVLSEAANPVASATHSEEFGAGPQNDRR